MRIYTGYVPSLHPGCEVVLTGPWWVVNAYGWMQPLYDFRHDGTVIVKPSHPIESRPVSIKGCDHDIEEYT